MFCKPITLCLLNSITQTFQVTEGCKFFPQGMHDYHNERVSQDIYQQTNKYIYIYIWYLIRASMVLEEWATWLLDNAHKAENV